MALNTALSGLQAASTELSVIGNNVANVSTTGFKKSRVEFADVYATSNLGVSANSIGTGVNVADVSQIFSQGQIAYTDNNLDMAVSGLGFFMTKDSAGTNYTRSGAFRLDKEGFITNSKGSNLQGYLPKDGLIGEEVGDLQISADTLLPSATSTISLQVNLNSQDTPPTAPFQRGFSKVNPPSANSFNSSTSTTVYDSLGQPHTLTFYFVKMHAQNSWHAYVGVDGQDVTPAEAAASDYPAVSSGGSAFPSNVVPKPFTIVFDEQGLMIPYDGANTPLYEGPSYFTTSFGQSELYDAGQLPLFDANDFMINGTIIDPVVASDDVFSSTDALASTRGITEAINKYTTSHGATAIPDHAVLSMGDATITQHAGAITNIGTMTFTGAATSLDGDNEFSIIVKDLSDNSTKTYSIINGDGGLPAITDMASLINTINAATDDGGSGSALSTFLTASVSQSNELLLETVQAGYEFQLSTDGNGGTEITFDTLAGFALNAASTKDLFDQVTLNDTQNNLQINGTTITGTINRATAADDLIQAINQFSTQTRVEAYKDIDASGNVDIQLRTTADTEKGRNIQITSNPLSSTDGFSIGFNNLDGTGQLGANLFEINNSASFNKVIRANYTLSMEHTSAEIIASPAKVDLGPITSVSGVTVTPGVDPTFNFTGDLFTYTDLSTLQADGSPVSITIGASGTTGNGAATITNIEDLAKVINDELYYNYATHTDPDGNAYFSSPIAKAIVKRINGEDSLVIEAMNKGRNFRLDSAAATADIEFASFQISTNSSTLLVNADAIPDTTTGYENEPLILGGQNNGANLGIVGLRDADLSAGVIHTKSDQIRLDEWLNISQQIDINMSASTQFGTDFSVGDMSQDGFTAGLLSNIDVDDVGIIYARYNNGESAMLGQVALAYFSNPQGLKPVGDSAWTNSFSSGSPLEGKASTGRFGVIQAGSLESSNVDLTEELVTLIVAQRNFQANAQTIRTFDQVTQTITNIR